MVNSAIFLRIAQEHNKHEHIAKLNRTFQILTSTLKQLNWFSSQFVSTHLGIK